MRHAVLFVIIISIASCSRQPKGQSEADKDIARAFAEGYRKAQQEQTVAPPTEAIPQRKPIQPEIDPPPPMPPQPIRPTIPDPPANNETKLYPLPPADSGMEKSIFADGPMKVGAIGRLPSSGYYVTVVRALSDTELIVRPKSQQTEQRIVGKKVVETPTGWKDGPQFIMANVRATDYATGTGLWPNKEIPFVFRVTGTRNVGNDTLFIMEAIAQ